MVVWNVLFDQPGEPPIFPLRVAPPNYISALDRCLAATGYPTGRKGCLIGVDGLNGSGKSSFAAWLAWQLGVSCLFLDDFRVRETPPLSWRLNEVERLVRARLDVGRPIVVESVFLLDALRQIALEPDLHVFVENEKQDANDAMDGLVTYLERARRSPRDKAVVRWSGKDPRED